MRYFFLLLLWVISLPPKAADWSKLTEWYFDPVALGEQLPDGIVTALATDKDGYVWIGTQEGLFRFDGYRMERLPEKSQSQTSTSSAFITSILSTSDGRLWVGSLSDGVAVYDSDTGDIQNYRKGQGLSHNRIGALAEDGAGQIWIGTNAGLDRFDPQSGQFKHFRFDAELPGTINDDHIRALLVDANDRLWVGTWHGLNRFDQQTGRFVAIHSDPEDAGSVYNDKIDSLHLADNGDIWIGSENRGAACITPTGEFHRLPAGSGPGTLSHPWVHTITEGDDKTLWLGTRDGGINIVDSRTRRVVRVVRQDPAIPNGPGMNDIGALITAPSGVIWVGTWGGGLSRYSPYNKAFGIMRHSPYDHRKLSWPDIGSMLELPDGTLWVGTHGKGIDIISPDKGVIDGIRTDVLEDGTIISMAYTPDTVWIGTQQAGLYRYSLSTRQLSHIDKRQGLIDNHIRRILPDNDGRLWLGTYGGLTRFDPGSGQFEVFGDADKHQRTFSETVYVMVQQKDGLLWVGSDNGLYFLKPGARQLQKIAADENRIGALSHNNIQGLLLDNKQQLWVGTAKGLDRFRGWHDGEPTFESLSRRLGHHGKAIWGNPQMDDDGRLWFGNLMVDPAKDLFQPFDKHDGVVATPWLGAFAKTDSGLLLYGTASGLLVVDPKRWQPHANPIHLVINHLTIDGKRFPPAKNISLAPEVRSFSVEFSALEYTRPQQVQYGYRLLGYDDKWINTDSLHRQAQFTNLDPGNYTLQLRAGSASGSWSPQTLSMTIRQQAAWFQRWWFRLLLLVTVVSALYRLSGGWQRLRLARLKRQKQALQLLVDQQTQALAQKNSELQQAVAELEQLSLTDQLTGAHNRRFMHKFIDGELSRLHREGKLGEQGLGFLLADIDHFKHINDTYGHEAGDRVLRQFVEVLNKTCRRGDWIIRWGGEEFLMVVRFVERSELDALAERLCHAIGHHPFTLDENHTQYLSCSIGISGYPFVRKNVDLLSWEQTLNLADHALYAVKNNGRNGWAGLIEKQLNDQTQLDTVSSGRLKTLISEGVIEVTTSLTTTTLFSGDEIPQKVG